MHTGSAMMSKMLDTNSNNAIGKTVLKTTTNYSLN